MHQCRCNLLGLRWRGNGISLLPSRQARRVARWGCVQRFSIVGSKSTTFCRLTGRWCTYVGQHLCLILHLNQVQIITSPVCTCAIGEVLDFCTRCTCTTSCTGGRGEARAALRLGGLRWQGPACKLHYIEVVGRKVNSSYRSCMEGETVLDQSSSLVA